MSRICVTEDDDIPGVMNLSRMTKEETDEAVVRAIGSSKDGEVMSLEESIDRFCFIHNIPRELFHIKCPQPAAEDAGRRQE